MLHGICIVATHPSTLPLTILLLSTAIHLWDGMGLDMFVRLSLCMHYIISTHLPNRIIMSTQHLYTFSSINVPYSIEDEKASVKHSHEM